MSQRVLITGASKGFGKLITKTLIDAGYGVIATMRNPVGSNAEAAAELKALGAEIVELDVTDDASVAAAVAAAGQVDVLINNAGLGLLGIQEAATVADWQKLFDVNVFGVQRVTAAFLPQMRARGNGTVIFIASLLGRMVFPFYGPYNATKWEVEAMAENYRVELNPLGIESLVIEPGGFATEFFESFLTPSNDAAALGYGPMADAPRQSFEAFAAALAENPAQDPQLVADAVRDLLAKAPGERPFRTTVDLMGMGEAVEGLNLGLEQVMQGIYGAFGVADMLSLKTNAAKT